MDDDEDGRGECASQASYQDPSVIASAMSKHSARLKQEQQQNQRKQQAQHTETDLGKTQSAKKHPLSSPSSFVSPLFSSTTGDKNREKITTSLPSEASQAHQTSSSALSASKPHQAASDFEQTPRPSSPCAQLGAAKLLETTVQLEAVDTRKIASETAPSLAEGSRMATSCLPVESHHVSDRLESGRDQVGPPDNDVHEQQQQHNHLHNHQVELPNGCRSDSSEAEPAPSSQRILGEAPPADNYYRRQYQASACHHHAPPLYQAPLLVFGSPTQPVSPFHQPYMSYFAHTGPTSPRHERDCLDTTCPMMSARAAQPEHNFQQQGYFWALQQSMFRSQQSPSAQLNPLYHQLYLAAPLCTPPYAFAGWPQAAYLHSPMSFYDLATTYHQQPVAANQLYLGPSGSPHHPKQFNQLAGQLIHLLPLRAVPTKTRQAYGMDKVWKDEFEQLFSQIAPNVSWNLVELESNPVILESPTIVGYQGHYLIDVSMSYTQPTDTHLGAANELSSRSDSCRSIQSETGEEDEDGEEEEEADEEGGEQGEGDKYQLVVGAEDPAVNEHDESDCESAKHEATLTSGIDSGLGSDTNSHHAGTKSSSSSSSVASCSVNEDEMSPKVTLGQEEEALKSKSSSRQLKGIAGTGSSRGHTASGSRLPSKFRMFIDSAKVRFCCDNCGHGWTSMKGRVVFWYELFEFTNPPVLANLANGQPVNQVVGYCAYKLFGQQCDICKIEDRFERPMWYPEEVSKVLNNLYNKIGQVYFGFKTSAIDKQRRAGKPKTSHNSSLCQACQDGLCTDVARFAPTR